MNFTESAWWSELQNKATGGLRSRYHGDRAGGNAPDLYFRVGWVQLRTHQSLLLCVQNISQGLSSLDRDVDRYVISKSFCAHF
jgi:hypothetical protein